MAGKVIARPPAFQSVSGLWDRRNAAAAAVVDHVLQFQSVSGLWDRRNPASRSRAAMSTRFNPSPVCGTGEISAAAS